MEETKKLCQELHRLKDSINTMKQKQQQQQQHVVNTQNQNKTSDKTKHVKGKRFRQKTSNQGAPPAPQGKTKRQRDRSRKEHKISAGSQKRWTRQRKRTSQRNKKRFKRREREKREESIQRLLTKERAGIANRMRWKEASVLNRIETAYAFVAYYRKTKRHNAALYLASMRALHYFDRPKNLALHDLCTELEPHQNLPSLLGLVLKCCPAPQFSYNNSTKTLKHFKRERFLKTYHARVDRNYDYNPCMYVPSTWIPKWW